MTNRELVSICNQIKKMDPIQRDYLFNLMDDTVETLMKVFAHQEDQAVFQKKRKEVYRAFSEAFHREFDDLPYQDIHWRLLWDK